MEPGGPAAELNKRASAQAYFIDLCRVLGVLEPADPDDCCFERGLTKTGSAAVSPILPVPSVQRVTFIGRATRVAAANRCHSACQLFLSERRVRPPTPP